MVSKQTLLTKLNPYIGSAKVLKYDQSTTDIVKELLSAHNDNKSEYDKIYKYFEYPTEQETLKHLFDFCKKNINYEIETGSRQSLKTPTAILVQGYGDCKQYAQFIGGVLDAINRNSKKIDWCYRFASYNPQKTIQHVFVVAKTKNGEVWIDPVLDTLNDKKQYNYKIDKKMSLYTISGFDDNEIGRSKRIKKFQVIKGSTLVAPKSIIERVKKRHCHIPKEQLTMEIIKEAKKHGKIAVIKTPNTIGARKKRGLRALSIKRIKSQVSIKNAAKAVKNAGKNVKKVATAIKNVALKVALAPARNAFLLLVRLNVAGMGGKLAKSNQGNLKKAWENLGGAYSKLKAAINNGQKVKVSGIDDFDNSIGTPIAAVLAAALPIIAKLASFLKSAGVPVDEIIQKGKEVVIDKVTGKLLKGDMTDVTAPEDFAPETTTESGIKTNIKSGGGGNATMTMTQGGGGGNSGGGGDDTNSSDDSGTDSGKSSTGGTMDYKKYIVPAAAILAVYLITKKK